jgi:SAM-dependent methyltransferase
LPVSRSAPGDAFGRTAEEYEAGRPSWPEALIDRVSERLGLQPAAVVLDLAAGTGKLTRLLTPRFARVIAVEPDPAMRAVLERVVPEAEALAGTADSIPLEDDSVDAVFCGEAFHWFFGDDVVSEIERVLRPRGGLVLLWNIPSGELEPPAPEAAERLLDEAFARGGRPGLPIVLAGEWRAPLERSGFEELRKEAADNAHHVEREGLVAHMLSISSIAALPDEERRELAERLRELLPEARYTRPFRTEAYWTRLG